MQPIQTNDAHYVARGLIRNMDYDILVCGSSMCENMHTDYVDNLYNKKSIKVVQQGSYSKDLESSLQVAAWTNKANVIIMALDSSMWNKPSTTYRLENIPHYTVSRFPILYSLPYLLNGTNIVKCVELIRQNEIGNVSPMNEWWCTDQEWCSEKSVYYSYRELKQLQTASRLYDKSLARENLNNIKKGVEACQKKGIEINFFIPPYSVANFAFSDYRYQLEDYKELWKELLQYDNVNIYAVQYDTALISDLNNYYNLSHYGGKVADAIIDDIYNQRYQLNLENIDIETEKFINWLDKYNWNELDEIATHEGIS